MTAQKRSENLQNVPIAITAVTAATIEKAGVRSITGLRDLVPSLNLTDTNGRLTMSLRGIGTAGVGPGVENPIALYVDGVYFGSTVASLLSLNNISQVDVLKGPQGTLFGRNATGGLLQVTTKTPTQQFSGGADLSYANYKDVTGRLYLSGGIADNLNADIAVYANHQADGWGKNLVDGKNVYDVDHDIAVRSKVVFTPSSLTKFTLIGDYENTRDTMDPFVQPTGTYSPFAPGASPALGYDINSTPTPKHTVEAGGASLRWDQQLGSLTLATISAYRADHVQLPNDIDGAPTDYESYVIQQSDKQFSQEVQLSSPSSGRLKWTGGLFYFYARNTAPTPVTLNDQGIVLNLAGVQKTFSKAAYGQASYEIFDRTNLTLGGRYTSERREALDASTVIQPIGAPASAAIVLPAPDAHRTFNKLTYRISLDHRFSDKVLAYASYNRGFKSGGYNLFAPGAMAFKPETLDTYELGLKTDLLDRKLRVNVAGFYNNYRDIQVAKFEGVGYNTVNGGEAHTYGVDFDVSAALSRELRLSAGGVLVNPKFTNYQGCPLGPQLGGTPPTPGSCAGNLLPLAAKRTFNFTAAYNRAVGSGTIELQTTGYYNSGFYFEPDNAIHQRGFFQLGSSVRWTPGRGRLYFELFGKNLTNQRVTDFGGTEAPGVQLVKYAAPRTYGGTIGFDF